MDIIELQTINIECNQDGKIYLVINYWDNVDDQAKEYEIKYNTLKNIVTPFGKACNKLINAIEVLIKDICKEEKNEKTKT